MESTINSPNIKELKADIGTLKIYLDMCVDNCLTILDEINQDKTNDFDDLDYTRTSLDELLQDLRMDIFSPIQAKLVKLREFQSNLNKYYSE